MAVHRYVLPAVKRSRGCTAAQSIKAAHGGYKDLKAASELLTRAEQTATPGAATIKARQ